MQTVPFLHHLSPASHRALAHQVTLNGSFDHEIFDGVTRMATGKVRVILEQCNGGLTVRIELGGSVNTITFARSADNGARLSAVIESLVSGSELPVGVLKEDEYLLVSDLEATLRDVVRERRGTWYLPVEGVEDLALLLRQSVCDPKRAAFRFELGGVGLTLPVLLPIDRIAAFELLNGCVQELVANYRTAA